MAGADVSPFVAFRRQAVDQQVAQHLRTITLPSPTRGIIQNENDDFMQPGGCIVLDNWAPTMRGVKLRGGSVLHCDLNALAVGIPAWANSTAYAPTDNPRRRYDAADASFWDCNTAHTSAAAPTTFAQDRAANPSYWIPAPAATLIRNPVISAFEYESGSEQRMFAAQKTILYDVTVSPAVPVAGNMSSGNYATAQLANAGDNWLLAVNDAGDAPLRYNGSTWEQLNPLAWGGTAWINNTAYIVDSRVIDGADSTVWKALVAHISAASGTFAADRLANPGRWTSAAAGDNAPYITGPIGSRVQWGQALGHVWKYRNRLFFIETASMQAWYLDINAIGGVLKLIPLAGAASRGGNLLFGASWSLDAGDGLDEKCLFVTTLGEVLIFTGSNPGDPQNWRQQGRYQLSAPMGMNAHMQVGGDMLIATVDGVIPLSQAITKDAGQLELAMLTRTIKPLWRNEVANKRISPWTLKKWDEYGAIFVAVPGGNPGNQYCLLANNATGAWGRFLGWDATCFLRLRGDMFFGTQDGLIMQADRTGYDARWDAFAGAIVRSPYVATMVGGWETFGASANQIVWHQARATFRSGAGEPFQPQLAATVDYKVVIPPPPAPGPDPGLQDVWDQGKWGVDAPWLNGHAYAVDDKAVEMDDITAGMIWRCTVAHTSAATGTFRADRETGGAIGKWVSNYLPSAADVAAYAQWDQPASIVVPVRNTMWVSIGETGYAHAPIVQVQVAQQATPNVEMIAISITYEPAGVNV
jgi:hypothetical protein